MSNRNVLLFILGTLVLFGGQIWLTSRYTKPMKPPVAVEQTQAAPAQASTPTQAAAPVVAAAPQAAPVAPAVDLAATHTTTTTDLTLTWQVATGALKQAVWRQDGTLFFPGDFPGVGGVQGTAFQAVHEEAGAEAVTVVFENAQGARLAYRVPRHGSNLSLAGVLPQGARLQLVTLPTDLKPVEHLGRVFTLTEKKVEAVTWLDILHDPFFSFLGAKRKVLPPAEARLGLDAGLDADPKAQRNHYFAALWKLPTVAGRDESGYTLAPEGGRIAADLYLGPKQAAPLEAFEKPFTRVIDYGFFGAVAQLFFWVLQKLHAVIGNWGWAIIVFTVILRAVTWQLNSKQIVSMLRMKDFEPHQKALQARYEKFGNDMTKKAEMQKELMELYKKNGHNPMGGCLPMLLQMPVFLAFWSMLNAVFELRHAPFFGWIHDLSMHDPYYIYPVLMGASMFVQQAMTPATGDPAQRKMMMILMPVMMMVMFAKLPVGVIIYYFASNLIGIAQTWWVKRNYVPQPIKV
ncbi:MAG TPA: YidC/Oxa1 family insertase periplasmic-domain containing protein [Holophagaceae bacterium]